MPRFDTNQSEERLYHTSRFSIKNQVIFSIRSLVAGRHSGERRNPDKHWMPDQARHDMGIDQHLYPNVARWGFTTCRILLQPAGPRSLQLLATFSINIEFCFYEHGMGLAQK
ncbi:hypothetical protein [Desulfosarcina ovata]|uniref:hypothetical protein n=1 Tax=Desulfosarcina ovata TaxID=83564 RepID=UPI00139179D6|nr:hypothetical protein [Desulfosarcina ovata]